MVTRVRLGQLQVFKEGAYKQEPRLEKVKIHLATKFGYPRLEARELAVQICKSLDNYVSVQEAMAQQRQRLYDNHTARPTQTAWRQAHGNV